MSRLLTSLALLSLLPAALACPLGFEQDSLDSTLTASLPVYERDSGVVHATVGDSFLVHLVSNPTTGYSWQISEGYVLEDNAPGVQLAHCVYERHGKSMPGAGGAEKWVFTATAEGEQLIPFQYARPWMKAENEAAQPDFVLTVEVSPQPLSQEQDTEQTV